MVEPPIWRICASQIKNLSNHHLASVLIHTSWLHHESKLGYPCPKFHPPFSRHSIHPRTANSTSQRNELHCLKPLKKEHPQRNMFIFNHWFSDFFVVASFRMGLKSLSHHPPVNQPIPPPKKAQLNCPNLSLQLPVTTTSCPPLTLELARHYRLLLLHQHSQRQGMSLRPGRGEF